MSISSLKYHFYWDVPPKDELILYFPQFIVYAMIYKTPENV